MTNPIHSDLSGDARIGMLDGACETCGAPRRRMGWLNVKSAYWLMCTASSKGGDGGPFDPCDLPTLAKAILRLLAATRTPEPPDSGDGGIDAALRSAATDAFTRLFPASEGGPSYEGDRLYRRLGDALGLFSDRDEARSGSPAPEGGESMSGWEPDWRVHPGESLREAIAALGISEAAFARKIGVTPPFVSNIVRGRKGIGPKVALKLEAAGVGPAQFWLAMQMQFDLHRAREEAAAIAQQDTDRAAR